MQFNIRELLSGIGILLFAMSIFEQAIHNLGGRNLKKILQKYTRTSWSAIWTGTWSTALLQSSSLVSLIVLAFVGAGVMALSNSIGVIIGANIGTTVTSLIIAKLGFGDFKISAFSLPMIAVGGISLIFLKSDKRRNRAKLLIGFGLLFLGLDFMKHSVDALKASFDLAAYKHYSLRAFGALGVIVTLIIQSSSAVGVLTLAALASGIITFPASIAIVMGANIGTTFTAVIASLGGSSAKRQVALSQVLFNLGSGVIGVIFFRQYIWLTNEVLGFGDNPVMGNAVLNAIFNVSTAIIFGFILMPFTKLIQWIIPTKKDNLELHVDSVIRHKKSAFALPTLYALHEDGKLLIDKVFNYNIFAFGFKHENFFNKKCDIKDLQQDLGERDKKSHIKQYEDLEKISNTMLSHLLPAKQEKIPKRERKMADYIEKTIYASLKSAKSIKNIHHDILDLKASDNKSLQEMHATFMHNNAVFYKHVAKIIDRTYSKENFKELIKAGDKIKNNHKEFINNLAKKIAKKKITESEISSLINLDNYIYKSTRNMIIALQYTYLTDAEEKIFENMKE